MIDESLRQAPLAMDAATFRALGRRIGGSARGVSRGPCRVGL